MVRAFLRAAGLMNSGVAGSKLLPANWTLHIVGDGPERQAIENLIKSAGPEAERRIKLLGYKTGEDLQREVGNARFSVLCSEWRENMPYSGFGIPGSADSNNRREYRRNSRACGGRENRIQV